MHGKTVGGRVTMGRVCENCGWRENPNDNTGRGCIFVNNKKKKVWDTKDYNQPCSNYIADSKLREHLKKLLECNKGE